MQSLSFKSFFHSLNQFWQRRSVLIVSVIVFFLLIAFVMPPNQWHDNEEGYLGAAWRRFSPEKIAAISALTDPVAHRFLFDYLTGFTIQLIGFRQTHFIGRLCVALFYAISLTAFFRTLRFRLSVGCLIFLVFVGLGQNILGGEWLFNGFEPKTIAYPFVFLSFACFLTQRYRAMYVLLAGATYFHFLVGAFWCLVTLISQAVWTKNLQQTGRNVLAYTLLCAPLFVIIAIDQLHHAAPLHANPSVNWIYGPFRNPHHLTPFASAESFRQWYYNGIAFLIGMTLAAIALVRSQFTHLTEKASAQLILGLHLYLVICLGLAWLDQDTVLGKFYVFRPSSLILFLALCVYTYFLKNRLVGYPKELVTALLCVVTSLTVTSLSGHTILYQSLEAMVQNQQPISIAKLGDQFITSAERKYPRPFKNIVKASNKTDIFLIDPQIDLRHLSFERQLNRPTLVSIKTIPTEPERIIRWYSLIQQRKQLFESGCPSPLIAAYPVRYLLAAKDNLNVNQCGSEIYQDAEIKLIKLPQRVSQIAPQSGP